MFNSLIRVYEFWFGCFHVWSPWYNSTTGMFQGRECKKCGKMQYKRIWKLFD